MTAVNTVPHAFRLAPARFIVRTPLLPFDAFLAWGAGSDVVRLLRDGASAEAVRRAYDASMSASGAILRAHFEAPVVREALLVASPALVGGLDQLKGAAAADDKRLKIERALARYFSRMSVRATPFGLFSGCSVGEVGRATNLTTAAAESYERHTRLDASYVASLIDALLQIPSLREELLYVPNQSLYEAGGQLRYVEAAWDGEVLTHRLVGIAADVAGVKAVLQRARGGCSIAGLAGALVDADPVIEPTGAERFVHELVQAQLIVPKLRVPVTGESALDTLADELVRTEAGADAGRQLKIVNDSLARLDREPLGVAPERYDEICAGLRAMGEPPDISKTFQVDMTKPGTFELAPEVAADVLDAVMFLETASTTFTETPLARFRKDFVDRYGDEFIPLAEALDDEVGIGFGRRTKDEECSAVAGLSLPMAAEAQAYRWTSKDAWLLRKVQHAVANREQEIVLDKRDLSVRLPGSTPLPSHVQAVVVLGAASAADGDAGRFEILVRHVFGPSGARMLGRFCHTSAAIRAMVGEHLAAEERTAPDAIFAEVVHFPGGRVGNVIARPVLRDWELVYLGRSGADEARQIPISDLLVGVRRGRIVLWSKTHGREVVPRLSTAHNFMQSKSLPVYSFLGQLQAQDRLPGATWNWGALKSARFLPRVRCGRIILHRAHWQLDGADIRRITTGDRFNRFCAAQALRQESNWPRFLELADGDNEYPVDLDNPMSVDSFVDLVDGRMGATLLEMWPSPERLPCKGPEGSFAHELVFLVQRESAPQLAPAPPSATTPQIRRTVSPGDDWLYLKVYCGSATVDRVLTTVLAPLIRDAEAGGVFQKWHFVRYADPEWHVRLRFYGRREMLWSMLLPRLSDALRPLVDDRTIWKVQVDSYRPEVERYGGSEGIELAETMFWADSEQTLGVIERLEGEGAPDTRWAASLRAIDQLLSDCELSLDERLSWATGRRDQFYRELRIDQRARRQLGDRFRLHRQRTAETMRSDTASDDALAVPQARERSRVTMAEMRRRERGALLCEPLFAIVGSLSHMHVNRMFRSAGRTTELVLFDFLSRHYESSVARLRATKPRVAAETAAVTD